MMSSLRLSPQATGSGDASAPCGYGGIPALLWCHSGLRLFVAEASETRQLMETRFLKPPVPCSHIPPANPDSWSSEDVHVLHGDDRLVLITEAIPSLDRSDGWCASASQGSAFVGDLPPYATCPLTKEVTPLRYSGGILHRWVGDDVHVLHGGNVLLNLCRNAYTSLRNVLNLWFTGEQRHT